MSLDAPTVAILTTQPWPQVSRLATRFAAYGCRVVAICPKGNQLNRLAQLGVLAACYPLGAAHPLRSIEFAIGKSGAEFLIPGDDLAVWLLHALCLRSPALLPLVERSIGPANSFAQVRSRRRLLSLASKLDIAVPRTQQVESLAEIQAWADEEPLPYVIKKDGTFGGSGVRTVNRREDLATLYAQLTAVPSQRAKWERRLLHGDPTGFFTLPGLCEPEISVQAFVEGTAANAMFACDQGRVLGAVQARVIASRQRTGPALMIQLIRDPRIERAGRLLASELQLSGFFGLDFILDAETGVPCLLEMNPRCTQLGHFEHAGQPDLAGILWARWTGRDAPAAANSDPGDAIAFYPQALEWAADSPFLLAARFDVRTEDLPMIDGLPTGNPSMAAALYRTLLKPLLALTHTAVTEPAREAFFFPAAGSLAVPSSAVAASPGAIATGALYAAAATEPVEAVLPAGAGSGKTDHLLRTQRLVTLLAETR